MQEQQVSVVPRLEKNKSNKIKKVKKPWPKAKKRDFILMLVFMALSVAAWVVLKFVLGHSEEIGSIRNEVFPSTAFTISLFGSEIAISQSIVSGWITVGVILFIALLFRIFIVPRLKFVPGKIQYSVEWLVNSFNNIAGNNTGHYGSTVGPIIFGFAAFICVGTLLEMLGIRPPNADLNTCIAMAISTFILIQVLGFRAKKGRRFLHFLNPINIITDLAVPVSMSFRLFGSILSGSIIMGIIYIAIAPVVPAFLSVMFTLFHALIQSYIFATLSATFIGEAVE